MIDSKCLVCRSPDRRRLIELGWNGGMSGEAIARVLDQKGLSGTVVLKHLKEHVDGDGNVRAVVVEPEKPLRDRVLDIQRMQVEEFERRVNLAKARADLMNAEHEGEVDYIPVDWSHFFDILDKDAQAAIGSILKTQGLNDKREKAVADTKLGLFDAMARAGLAPKALRSGELPALPSGDDDDDE